MLFWLLVALRYAQPICNNTPLTINSPSIQWLENAVEVPFMDWKLLPFAKPHLYKYLEILHVNTSGLTLPPSLNALENGLKFKCSISHKYHFTYKLQFQNYPAWKLTKTQIFPIFNHLNPPRTPTKNTSPFWIRPKFSSSVTVLTTKLTTITTLYYKPNITTITNTRHLPGLHISPPPNIRNVPGTMRPLMHVPQVPGGSTMGTLQAALQTSQIFQGQHLGGFFGVDGWVGSVWSEFGCPHGCFFCFG